MSNGKTMIIHLIVGLIKKALLYKMCYFPEQHDHSKNEINVELGLPSYATKSDLKNIAGVDTPDFAKKNDLAYLESEVDQLDIDKLAELDADKLKPVAVDLKKEMIQLIMMLLKRLYMMNWFKKLKPLILVNLLKKQIMKIR